MFGSGARVKLLRQFLMHPGEEFYIRQLTRILDEQINSLRRELENLQKIGMLKSTDRNRRKFYRINPHFPLLHELTSIIRKTNESNKTFLRQVNKLGDVEAVILTGSFIQQEDASTDLFIVGDIKKDELEAFINEYFEEQNVKYTLMSQEDFLYRIALKDKFISDLFGNKDNIILKNKLKKDTSDLL